jgi:hypothetical protein
MYPLGIHGAYDGLAGGAYGKALRKLFVAAVRDPRHLGREALHMLGLLEQQALRYEKRKYALTCPYP